MKRNFISMLEVKEDLEEIIDLAIKLKGKSKNGKSIELLKIVHDPDHFTNHGIQQTATGYGSKLSQPYWVVCSDSRQRRLYAVCHSNAASHYVIVDGKRLTVSDADRCHLDNGQSVFYKSAGNRWMNSWESAK